MKGKAEPHMDPYSLARESFQTHYTPTRVCNLHAIARISSCLKFRALGRHPLGPGYFNRNSE